MIKKAFNMAKYHYFVLVPERQWKQETDMNGNPVTVQNMSTTTFRTYTDKAGVFGKPGIAVQYVTGRDENGRDKGKYFTLSQSHNAFMVNEGDTDIYGKKMIDFLQAYPGCEDSPNGTYHDDGQGGQIQSNKEFRLMDTDADAEVALDATKNRAKAELSASELDEQTLMEVAAIGINVHGKPDKIMRHKVVEWSGKRPKDYFEVLNAGDRFLRAVVRKSVADGTLRESNGLHYWGTQLLGSSEDATIAYLLEHEDQLTALREKANLKVPEQPAKKPGRKAK